MWTNWDVVKVEPRASGDQVGMRCKKKTAQTTQVFGTRINQISIY